MDRLHFLHATTAAALLAASPALAADAAPPVAGHVAAVTAGPIVADVVRSASDLPGPLARREPATVKVDLETVEVTGQLADGSTYHYWTFNRKVPGPFVRVRVGDTVDVRLKNADDSMMAHNVDFHAVTGPGGGAVATVAAPGESRGFSFKALKPGLYVYHCATPMVAQHIANGMYGLILVEPEGGLTKVDREFYVMQGEIYTEQANGTKGELTESIDKLLSESPEYYVFNGAVDALAKMPLKAKTGETVRIFFGDGGPNKTSSFHVIGEIFDRAYPLASLTSPPVTDVQTMTVPPGGAAIAEFKVDVPGRYILVDHALSRMERGLKGLLVVEGPERPDIFRPHQKPQSGASSGH
ncbi:MAG: copper-containing nitrite reductase [Sphingomicrobium sp.]